MATLSDAQLALNVEVFKVFESTRSYKASLLVQAMRLAEMEGNATLHDSLKTEADAAKTKFQELSDIGKKMQAESAGTCRSKGSSREEEREQQR